MLASLLLHALGASALLALAGRSSGVDAATAPATLEILVEVVPEAAHEVAPEANHEPAPLAARARAHAPLPSPNASPDGTTMVHSPADAPPQSSHGGAPEEWLFPPGGPQPGESARPGDGLTSAIRKGVATTVRQVLREAAVRDAHRTVPAYGDRELSLGLTPGGELVKT